MAMSEEYKAFRRAVRRELVRLGIEHPESRMSILMESDVGMEPLEAALLTIAPPAKPVVPQWFDTWMKAMP